MLVPLAFVIACGDETAQVDSQTRALIDFAGDRPHQAAWLEDGVIDEAEYEAAVLAAMACAKAHGISVSGPESAGHQLVFSMTVGEDADPAELEAVADVCFEDYLFPLEQIYLSRFRLSVSELEALRADYEVCMAELGFNVDLPQDLDRITETPEIAAAHDVCAEQTGMNDE